MKHIITVTVLTLLAGCGAIEKNERSNVPKAERQDGTSAKFSLQGSGLSLDGNLSLVVDLTQYHNDAPVNPDQASLPSCLRPFSADDELGTIECADDEEKAAPLFARHTRQTCSGANSFNDVAPSEGLTLKGCKTVIVRIFNFSPAIEVTLKNN